MIVCLGGGKGLSSTTRALHHMGANFGAIVTTSDNGGSTGLLRRKYNIPAVGDYRRVIDYLNTSPFSETMESRYEGHALGNLVILDLVRKLGFQKGMDEYRKAMNVKYPIYPQFTKANDLVANVGGKKVEGELQVDESNGRLESLNFTPELKVNPQALKLLSAADSVVMGPGSIYTSVIPHLLPEEERRLISKIKTRVFVLGIKNDVPIINGYKVSDYIKTIEKFGFKPTHILIQSPSLDIQLDTRDKRIMTCDIAQDGHMHNPLRLGEELWKILR